ncbi:MAG: superoxide dismutase [Nitrospirae bacterium]|nr:superoxide dismutase [Candidatus Manganitrophaceae bacterium]
MKRGISSVRMLVAIFIFALFEGGGSVAVGATEAVETDPVVFTLEPSTHGNPEGVAFDRRTGAFFVGTVGDGTIYRGTLDHPTATPFIPGASGKSAAGMKVSHGKLYVAGAATGILSVFDLATKQPIASFDTGAGGFLNDLVVTKTGDVFVTDSFRPTLWHVTAAQVAAGSGTPEAIPVGPEIQYEAGAFNLNGIVAQKGGRELIVVQTSSGKLFRIDITPGTPTGRTIQPINVEPLVGGDGLLLDRGRLIVIQGVPPTLAFVQLRQGGLAGTVVARRTDPTLRGPSTIARARDLYLVVNADFATSTPPFTVSGLPVEADDEE